MEDYKTIKFKGDDKKLLVLIFPPQDYSYTSCAVFYVENYQEAKMIVSLHKSDNFMIYSKSNFEKRFLGIEAIFIEDKFEEVLDFRFTYKLPGDKYKNDINFIIDTGAKFSSLVFDNEKWLIYNLNKVKDEDKRTIKFADGKTSLYPILPVVINIDGYEIAIKATIKLNAGFNLLGRDVLSMSHLSWSQDGLLLTPLAGLWVEAFSSGFI